MTTLGPSVNSMSVTLSSRSPAPWFQRELQDRPHEANFPFCYRPLAPSAALRSSWQLAIRVISQPAQRLADQGLVLMLVEVGHRLISR